MKKLFKGLFTAASAAVMAVSFSVTAYADDVSIDVSEAKESTNWGQSITIPKAEFDAERITKDSIIKVAYEAKDYDGDELPIELIFQSWANTTSPNADDEGGVWAKVQASEFDAKTATYTYEDIVKAYGTEDFSQVQAIHVGDAGKAPIICKGLAISDCSKARETLDVSIDCSDAKDVSSWSTSLMIGFETFDSTTLTNKSTIEISFETDAEDPESSPVDIAIQSWENSTSPFAKDNGDVWVTVEPEKYTKDTAVFTYDAMVDAYGTADFSRVSALNICGTGKGRVKIKSVTIKNCVPADKGTHVKADEATDDSSEQEGDESSVSEADESKAEPAETTATAAAAAATDNNDSDKGGSNILWIVIGVVAGVGIAIAVIFVILTRKSSEEYDISRGRMVSKKKHKTKW